ncbi:hypothetical protein HK097_009845 [Rhizophlyctis rosea]|uniref:separase n=1 Tax=Rhizophlyctis rosea TaxID=64517 RepID=A0AAD5SJ68_9FUNG|nr:hypothetical protein HK097_009845 [Rhizophlyctis rosea]
MAPAQTSNSPIPENLLSALANPQKCTTALIDQIKQYLSPALTSHAPITSKTLTNSNTNTATKPVRRVGKAKENASVTVRGRPKKEVEEMEKDQKATNKVAANGSGEAPTPEDASRFGSFAMKVLNTCAKVLAEVAVTGASATTSEEKENISNTTREEISTTITTTTTSSKRTLSRTSSNASLSTTAAVKRSTTLTSRRRKVNEPESENPPPTVSPTKPVNATVQNVAAICMLALETLDALEPHLAMKRLDIEKAACNIAGKLVEVDAPDNAIKFLLYIHTHLSSSPYSYLFTSKTTTKHTSTKRSTTRPISSRATSATISSMNRSVQRDKDPTTSSKPSSAPLSSSTSTTKSSNPEPKATPTVLEGLLRSPIRSESDDEEVEIGAMSLIVTCMFQAVRCWLGLEKGKEVKALEQLVTQPHGMFDSCLALKNLDAAAGGKMFDAVYRILYKISLNGKDWSPRDTLLLRKTALLFLAHSPAYTFSMWSDHVLKFGAAFEKDSKELPDIEKETALLDFFHFTLYHAEQETKDVLQVYEKCISWCEACAQVAKKARRMGMAERAYSCIQSMALTVLETKSEDAAALVCLVVASVEVLNMNLEEVFGGGRINIPVKDFVHKSSWLRERIADGKSDVLYEPVNWRILLRSLDGLRKTVRKGVDTCAETSVPAEVAEVLKSVVDLLGICDEDVRNGKAKNEASKAIPLLIDMHTLLARTLHTLHSSSASITQNLQTAASLSSTYRFHDGLRWVSSTFHNVGGIAYKKRDFGEALGWFGGGCKVLEVLVQKVGGEEVEMLLAKRLDLCGTCARESGDFTASLNYYRKALRALPQPVYHALATDTSKTADLEFASRLLENYIKVAVSDSITKPYEPIRSILEPAMKDIEVLMRVGMDELKILQALHAKIKNTVREQILVLDGLLELCDERREGVLQARMLVEKAQALRACDRRQINAASEPEELCRQAIEILKSEDESPHSDQISNELAMSYALMAMCLNENGRYEVKPFRMAVQAWRKVLRKVATYSHGLAIEDDLVQDVKSRVGDVERTVHYMELLADYFDVLNQPLNRILILRLLLKMATVRGTSDENSSYSVRLYANIAKSYIALGYTGQAGLALSQGKAIVDASGRVDSDAVTWWNLCYCFYLSEIGNVEKCRLQFKKIPPVTVSADKGAIANVQTLLYLAFANFVWANSALSLGKLVGAAYEADASLRLLGKAARHFVKRWADKETKSSSPGKGEMVHKRLVQNGRWHLLQRFLEMYHWLGNLYLRRGSVPEAEHYFQEGLELSKSVRSNIWTSGFLLGLAEMEGRRGREAKCEGLMEEVEGARKDVALDLAVRDVAIAKIRSGDQHLRGGESETAVNLYEEAEALVGEAMSERVIVSLEERELGGTETPRERRLVVSSPSSRRVSSSATAIQFECFVLSYIKAELLSRAGLALGNAGKLDLAEKKLMTEADALQRGFEQAEYFSTLANLKVKKLGASLRGNALYEMFSDSAFSLPWGMPSHKPTSKSTAKLTKAIKAAQLLQKSLAQAEELYLEAYRFSHSFGSAHLVHQACHGLVLVEMMKAYLTGGVTERKEEVADVALRAAFYLEMGKGLTARREMLSALSEKVQPRAKAELQWPSGDDEDAAEDPFADTLAHQLHALYANEVSNTPSSFQNDIINILPKDWIVCSLSLDVANEDMYVTRMERDKVPVVVRLPLKRQALREGEEDGLGYDVVFEELKEIWEGSTSMMKNGVATTRDEKVGWWKERKELDGRLRDLVKKVETTWLGGFKGLLINDPFDVPEVEPLLEEFQETIEKIIFKSVAKKASARNKMLPIETNVCRLLLRLGAEPDDDKEVEDALYYLMDAYQYSGVGVDYDEISIDTMTFDFKDALVKFHEDYAKLRAKHQLKPKAQKHIILIPDKYLQTFPWESIPVLRGKPVSRVPCLAFLRDRVISAGMRNGNEGEGKWKMEVDKKKTFYLLNPSGDLKDTQKEFEGELKSQREWNGIIGRSPDESECIDALSREDIFLYFGHGGGEQYIRGHRIRRLPQCSVALLMGCSSGFLQPGGEFDPSGTALNYLMAGSPTLVANLWDVTDRDIDRFSRCMMEEWGLVAPQQQSPTKRKKGAGKARLIVSSEGKSIVEAVATARGVCHLEYLIGAAPVVYGVPVWVRKDS